jgi:hypothetical protein
MPGADLRPLLDAALAELDGAIDALGAQRGAAQTGARLQERAAGLRARRAPPAARGVPAGAGAAVRLARTAPCAAPTRPPARCSGRPAATRPGSRSARWSSLRRPAVQLAARCAARSEQGSSWTAAADGQGPGQRALDVRPVSVRGDDDWLLVA